MNSATLSMQGIKLLFLRGHLRSVGTQIVVVAVALLISALLLLGVNVTKLQQTVEWVERSDNVTIQLSEVEVRLDGIELTLRGYALTDDPNFLLYQRNEKRYLWNAMHKVAAAAIYEPGRVARYQRLHDTIKKRLALADDLVAVGPGRAQAVAAAIRDPAYRSTMLKARTQVEEFRADELKVLGDLQSATARQSKHTYEIAIGIVVLAFCFGALGLVFALFGMKPR